jgi:ribulose-phosphate 3-epimerase
MPAIAPSILAADFSRLGELVKATEAGGADRIHIDVMDGHFVPNLSMGAVVVKGLRPITRLPLEVHLMVDHPARFIDGFLKAGADTILFHLEVQPDPIELIRHVRGHGKKVGLAFNPDFDLRKVEPHLADIDLALCMTVVPGFGGQAYIPESTLRIQKLRQAIDRISPRCELEVDGGIDRRTISEAAKAGATVFVAGTAIFAAPEGPTTATRELARLAESARRIE